MRCYAFPAVMACAAVALALSAGCRSVPVESGGPPAAPSGPRMVSKDWRPPEPDGPPRWSPHSATNTPAAMDSAGKDLSTQQVVEPEAAAPRKPITSKLEFGSRKALLDGVLIWLSQPAELGAGKKPRATYLDRRTTLDPIMNMDHRPLVTGRAFRVMLDPGHGGEDSGAISSDGKRHESTYVLDIARRASSYLNKAGYEVRMTRNNDKTFVTLEDRPLIASAWQADVYVSIHLNAAVGNGAKGMEAYVIPPPGVRATAQSDQAKLSAEQVERIAKTYPGNRHNDANLRLAFCIQRRLKITTPFHDRGIKRARFSVLRDAKMPAVLVEAGFISNSEDADFMSTASGRERIARGIYQGIVDYATGRSP